ncbi:DUF1254 domain-containing protein [Vibrio lamellibrachiae]|uniref:DUF1254 domain-containing protein n=1 Tax=Vibrio lamellibrachiae TaxID=2910253 RepID=UPI003D123B53
MKKSILAVSLLITLSGSALAQEKFATLGEHLPEKGEPTEFQMQYSGPIEVSSDNFILAESDKYFFEQQGESEMNTFKHADTLITPDNQTVVRQNRDTLYSKGIFDTNGGVKFELPKIDTYQSLQIIDEQHRTIGVIYSEEGKNSLTVTPDMLSSGEHVWVVMRTQVKSMAEQDLALGREQQRMVKVSANSSNSYIAKGFEQKSRETTRLDQEKSILKIDLARSFGAPGSEVVREFDAKVATAMGFGGLPSKHAYYKVLIAEDRTGSCQSMTFEKPPIQEKGFFSVTTYGPDGYIHTYNYATSSREITPNQDGSITVNFNCEGAKNNLDVASGWTGILRMYMPHSVEEIVEYGKTVEMPHTVETYAKK